MDARPIAPRACGGETGSGVSGSGISMSRCATSQSSVQHPRIVRWQWWLMVVVNILFLIGGQASATLLGRFYYNQGGNSTWMSTLVQRVGFPFLFLPLILFSSSSLASAAIQYPPPPPFAKLVAVYLVICIIVAGDNLKYSYGLRYLSVSTYSLICASQLGFNAVLSYFINAQKFTPYIFNSVILLTFSSSLLGVDEDSNLQGISRGKYALGFVLTVGASATYSLILSLMQVKFQKVTKKEIFLVVLDMQIYTSFVTSCAAVIGLFASGEWMMLDSEMKSYALSYIMTLVWIAVSWQVASVGMVGLILLVSSLFSNVISTLALPIVPIFAVIFFHDKMGGIKVIALLIALWGSASYIYQNYIDDCKARKESPSSLQTLEEITQSTIP